VTGVIVTAISRCHCHVAWWQLDTWQIFYLF